MAMWIKQSTSIDVPMGPFVDEANGVTPEEALTITQGDVRLKKNGGAWAQKAAAQTLSHEEFGWYELTLDATDTNTLGQLIVSIYESGALPVWREFQVVTANAWDTMIGGTDALQADVREYGGVAGTFASGRAEGNMTHIAGSAVSTTTAQLGINVVQLGGSAISQAAGLINANMTQLSGDATAADNLETMLDGSGGQSFTATFAGNQTGNLSGSVGSVTGAVGSVTGAVGSVTAGVTVATGGITAASLATDTITAAKLAADAVAEIADGVWDEATSGHTTADTYGDKFGAGLKAGLKALTTAGSSTTTIVLNATTGIDGAAPSSTDDFYNGKLFTFTSGALAGQPATVTDYTGSTQTLTVSGLTSTPASGVTGWLS